MDKNLEDLKNISAVQVVQTEEWYYEVCDKCCGFIGHLKEYPEVRVEVIVGWKDTKIWKPIYKEFKNSPIGTTWEVANDSSSYYGFEVKDYGDFLGITLNTQTVKVTGFKELEFDETNIDNER